MIFDPFTDEAIDNPYRLYRIFREREPIHWSEKLRSWLLFRHDDVTAFFRDDVRLSSDRTKATKFKGPRGESENLRTVSSDPPAHTAVRAMLTASLGPLVRSVGPRVDELIAALLPEVARAAAAVTEATELSGEVDLIEEFAYRLPINVIAELLGVPENERDRFRESSHAVARGMDHFYSGSDAGSGLRDMGAYFFQLMLERRGSRGDDLVRRLLGADYHGDRLSELEVVAMCTALVFAGHETTVNLIGNGVLALLGHPSELERLRAHPELIDTAIEELLRFDSPAQMISRTAACDFELRGRRIRTGDAVVAVLGAANRDPEVFEEPDLLDLGRDPNPHIAFGLGTHFCPGAILSRIEAHAALPALLRRFPALRLGDTPPRRRRTAVLRGLECLPVRV